MSTPRLTLYKKICLKKSLTKNIGKSLEYIKYMQWIKKLILEVWISQRQAEIKAQFNGSS